MALQNLQQYGCQTGDKLKEKSRDPNRNSSRNKNETSRKDITFLSLVEDHPVFLKNVCKNLSFLHIPGNMRQVQPETLPKNSNFSSCLQNIKLKNNTT
jgi:hypothetical protein